VSYLNCTRIANGPKWLIGECLGNPVCGAGLIPRLGTASFLPYPLALILLVVG